MGGKPKYTFLKIKHINDQEGYEIMLRISNHHGYANQNHKVITSLQ